MGLSKVGNRIQNPPTGETEEYSVVVIGAGMGGIYALHRFADLGHDVHGFEGATVSGASGITTHIRVPASTWKATAMPSCLTLSFTRVGIGVSDTPHSPRFCGTSTMWRTASMCAVTSR